MKRVGMALLVATLVFGLSLARGDEKADKTSAELKALDAKLTEAYKNHDAKMLEMHTSEDFIEISPWGKVHTRKEFLEHIGKKTGKFDEMKESDVQVRVDGNTAVLTGLLHIKGSVKDRDISGDYRWTRVYHHKKGGEWMCILEQHTYVLPPEKAKDKK
jgi:ketosteroid isomerase-like protein